MMGKDIMKQSGEFGNGVIILGRICKSSANPDVREFRVKISGSLPNDKKEEILGNLRENISICWHDAKIDQVIKEEDT
jgi:hypothetical protein